MGGLRERVAREVDDPHALGIPGDVRRGAVIDNHVVHRTVTWNRRVGENQFGGELIEFDDAPRTGDIQES